MKQVNIKWMKNMKIQTLNCEGMETVQDILIRLHGNYYNSIILYYDYTALKSTMPIEFLPNDCMLLCEPALTRNIRKSYIMAEKTVKRNEKKDRLFNLLVASINNADKKNKISAKYRLQKDGYIKERIHFFDFYYESITDKSKFDLHDYKFNLQIHNTELKEIREFLRNTRKVSKKKVDIAELNQFLISDPSIEFARAYFGDLCHCISKKINNAPEVYLIQTYLNNLCTETKNFIIMNNEDIRLLMNLKHEYYWLRNMIINFNIANPENKNFVEILDAILSLYKEIIDQIELFLTTAQQKRYKTVYFTSLLRMFKSFLFA